MWRWFSQKRRQRATALVTSLLVLFMSFGLGTALVSLSTEGARLVMREEQSLRTFYAAEAGLEFKKMQVWKQFKVEQKFDSFIPWEGASPSNPRASVGGDLGGGLRYACGIVGQRVNSNFSRELTFRSVGWVDRDGDGLLEAGEPRTIVEQTVEFTLERSGVFDYAYFANNYGWMYGFGANDLIVNGDMRANGNFDFSGGTPTINGSVYAAANNKLIPPAAGIVNITPTQWTNSFYNSQNNPRARQAYDPTRHGAKGSPTYEQWRDLIYDQTASLVNGRVSGAVVADARGTKTYSGTVLDPNPTQELPMPDLDDISRYINLSQNYIDQRQTFADGTPNPDYGQEAYVEVWNSQQNRYVRISTGGVVNGSAVLIGTSDRPIRIHGPVTFTGDVVIKGFVQGQGTLYAGRNVHIVGSIRYKNPPDFRGTDPASIERQNEKRDILGLAARGSIIMGNVKNFGYYPLYYMRPPFTKPRYDEYGNLIPAYDAMQIDEYGRRRYQSLYSDDYIASIAENINQIDAIMYTNFVGGGNIATGGGGCTINGSIICKDEAMVLYSLPLRLNYDNRIRDKGPGVPPLIDINLPRAPKMVPKLWQVLYGGAG
ncbi:MAG: pilus assembly PilX N-terminal domain-containing protein [Armatimonadota bacterium]|nr:pilus assembly PilX N-terminal domain-containing protein [Armatimonadota bacterium]